MKKLVHFALLSVAFVLSGAAFGQSNLLACQGNDTARWTNCFGSWTAPNGNRYIGEWKDGKYNGQGIFTFTNADKYVGEFKDSKSNGQGTYTFASGHKYVGEFKDEKFNGQGTFFRADGRIVLADWVEDKLSGRYIEYRADKTVLKSGIYKDGDLVTSQYIDPNSFTRITNDSAPLLEVKLSLIEAELAAAQARQYLEREMLRKRWKEEWATQSSIINSEFATIDRAGPAYCANLSGFSRGFTEVLSTELSVNPSSIRFNRAEYLPMQRRTQTYFKDEEYTVAELVTFEKNQIKKAPRCEITYYSDRGARTCVAEKQHVRGAIIYDCHRWR